MEHEWEQVYGFAEALMVRCVHCGLEVMTDDGWKGPIEKDTTLPPCQLVLNFNVGVVERNTQEAQTLPPLRLAGSTPVTDI